MHGHRRVLVHRVRVTEGRLSCKRTLLRTAPTGCSRVVAEVGAAFAFCGLVNTSSNAQEPLKCGGILVLLSCRFVLWDILYTQGNRYR